MSRLKQQSASLISRLAEIPNSSGAEELGNEGYRRLWHNFQP